MKFKLLKEKRNDLFNRNEIKVEINSRETPKTPEVEKWVIESMKVGEDRIKVKGIHGKFGSPIFEASVNIYDSFSDKDRIETKTKKQRENERKEREAKIKADAEMRKTKNSAEEKIAGGNE